MAGTGVTRKTDVCSGHSCFPPRPSGTWSPDFYVNGLNVERNTDIVISHCCGGCHTGNWVGTKPYYVNGLNIQTELDPISCGSVGAAHSPDFFVGNG